MSFTNEFDRMTPYVNQHVAAAPGVKWIRRAAPRNLLANGGCVNAAIASSSEFINKLLSVVRFRLVCCVLLITLAPIAVFAQEDDDTLEVELEEISIEATRGTETERSAPFSVSIYDPSENMRQLSPSATLTDVLSVLPGVWMNDRENAALGERLAIRGFGAQAEFGVRGVQVFLDGVPLTMPDGQTVLNVVDPAFVNRAEVIRGPASSLWGNASGGVLFLSTADYPSETQARFRSMTGSFGMARGELEVGAPIGPHRVRGFLSHYREDGFRNHSYVQRTRGAVFSDWDLSPKSRLRVHGVFLNQPQSENPSSLTKEAALNNPRQARSSFRNLKAGETNQHGQVGASYLRETPVGLFRATGYGVGRAVDNPLPFAHIRVRRQAGGTRFQLRNQAGSFNWGIGSDFSLQHDERWNWKNIVPRPDRRTAVHGDTLTLHQTENVTNAGVFARASKRFNWFEISAGARYDALRFGMNDQFLENGDQSGRRLFSAFSPSVGVAAHIKENVLYLNGSTSFEAPTTTELVNRPDMTGGFNQQLEPKRTRGLELGWRGGWPAGRLTYDVALFGYRVNGLLVRGERQDGRAYYQNEGQSRHVGIEWRLAWQPFSDLIVQETFNYSDFRFTDGPHEGSQVPGMPPMYALHQVRWTPGDFYVLGEVKSVNSYYVNNDNTATNGGYNLVNLRLGYTGFRFADDVGIEPFAAVDNLTDVRYNSSVVPNAFGGRYYEPGASRAWRVGVNMEL